ncbi:hypothetical protein [Alteromonas oceanisediminis]|uniref:hypothetical protein n=1 Tax=Alteromonas oceanisediminis TaxID=2836180 RepID=UPI001BDACB58|nr:hypothetical protein [Alteromonas oceanisediminis]MBT0586220.1 hypothetical protein [Alteromonas oceanisediminis]
MTAVTVFMIISGVLSICLITHFLDHKFNLRLNDWMNGSCASPFDKKASTTEHAQAQTITELRERVATLEKIVTEPAYELNRKINQL